MLLTVSKRLEFSASRRLVLRRWTESENLVAFGPETKAKLGTGRNYVAYFVFSGPVDPTNGMLINISEMKDRAGKIVHDRFDHKFLNQDHPAFQDLPPTVENVARQLYLDVAPIFADVDAELIACHLNESPDHSATFYANGSFDINHWFEFSAARRTMSPHLNDQENEKLFGRAMSMHGHNYRARLTFRSAKRERQSPFVRYDRIDPCLRSLQAELDHRDLNKDVRGMKDRPMTTESLADYIYERVNAVLPLHRVRLHERDDFFAEVWDDESVFLGMRMPFCAAHRLHAVNLSEAGNVALYGKCNNLLGHGHRYVTETTIGGDLDKRSGTLYNLIALKNAIGEALEPWQDRHLDLETDEFRESPSTGENIVRVLWPKVDSRLDYRVTRLRLWETANNRFTLRRTS
jgi:6-pyruvoyltetrahydropterin/6-carboxytetrahydropterin synthase